MRRNDGLETGGNKTKEEEEEEKEEEEEENNNKQFEACLGRWAKKTEDLVWLCATLATQEEFATLRAVRRRHAQALAGHLLHIVDCVPETAPPSAYADLLRAAVGAEALALAPGSAADSSALPHPPAALLLGAPLARGVPAAPLVPDVAQRAPEAFPPAPARVAAWVAARAEAIAAHTGLLARARDLVRLCRADLALPGLDLSTLAHDVDACCHLLYDRAHAPPVALAAYRRLAPAAKLALLLDGLAPDAFVRTCTGPAAYLLVHDQSLFSFHTPIIVVFVFHHRPQQQQQQ